MQSRYGIADYRPDIDGIRAIAVLGVLIYHLGFKVVPGGFVGVDIFFVISGFLITRLIIREVSTTGRLSFSGFYTRRFRRLFPSLFFTLLVSSIAAAILLTPGHLARFGASAFHAVLSISNIYFWQTAGYFDLDSSMKPLLHTWSLGLEEQFYLVWPVLLVWLLLIPKKWVAPVVLFLIALISLFFNYIFVDDENIILHSFMPALSNLASDGQNSTFYLLPFRFYEFSIGALLVWLAPFRITLRWVEECLLLLGAIMIGCSILAFNSETVWPGFSALIPCLGTALVIYSGQAPVLGKALSNRMMVGIGRISYSLYLIHWPIIVFYTYVQLRPLTLWEQLSIGLASLICAALMYRFVEQPFRLRGPRRISTSRVPFGMACATFIVGMMTISSSMWVTGGWSWRGSSLVSETMIVRNKFDRKKYTKNACTLTRAALKKYEISGEGRNKCSMDAETQIVVMGDSHAVDGFNTFSALYEGNKNVNLIYALKDAGADACSFTAKPLLGKFTARTSTSCAQRVEALNSDIWDHIDVVVLDVFGGHQRHYDNMKYLLNKHPDLKLIVMGTYIGTRPHHCSDLANRFATFDACKSPEFVTAFGEEDPLTDWAPPDRVIYVDRVKMFCGPARKLSDCAVTLQGGEPIFIDSDHFTLTASEEVARRLASDKNQPLAKVGLKAK